MASDTMNCKIRGYGADYAEAESAPAAADAAFFLAKYSSARARFLATDGLTHFFLPGNTVIVQPAASSFSLAVAEKALAFMSNLTDKSPCPKIYEQSHKWDQTIDLDIPLRCEMI